MVYSRLFRVIFEAARSASRLKKGLSHRAVTRLQTEARLPCTSDLVHLRAPPSRPQFKAVKCSPTGVIKFNEAMDKPHRMIHRFVPSLHFSMIAVSRSWDVRQKLVGLHRKGIDSYIKTKRRSDVRLVYALLSSQVVKTVKGQVATVNNYK